MRTRLARDRRNQQPAPWCWFGAELELDSQWRKAKIVRLRECGAEWRTHRSRAGGRECCGKLACHVTLWSSRAHWEVIDKMARDTTLALHALTYVIRLHADLTSEHGAPTLGTQIRRRFILADPELSRAVAAWAAVPNIGEASTKPYQRLPHDELYRRVREYLEKISSNAG